MGGHVKIDTLNADKAYTEILSGIMTFLIILMQATDYRVVTEKDYL